MIRPMRPDRLVRVLPRRSRAGAAARRRARSRSRRAIPNDTMIVDELGTLSFGEVDTRTNALAHALSDAGIGEGDGVAIMCPQPPRLHRGDDRALEARRRRALPEHRLRRPAAAPRWSSARSRRRSSTTRSSPSCSRRPASGASASSPGTTPSDPRRPDARRPDRRRRPRRRGAARARGPRGDPHLGHDRHAEGRVARQPASRSTRRSRCSRRIPLKARQTRPTSPRRCSTRGASRTSRSACCSARPTCCARKFDPETCLAEIARHARATRSRWCR